MLWASLRSFWIPTSEEHLQRSHERMLASLPADRLRCEDISAGIDGHTIHTVGLCSESKTSNGLAPIVLLHGYFMGSGSWSSILEDMTSGGREVFALDWPGWGRSSRPEFPIKRGIVECEDFFIERLEAWRKSAGLGRMILLGHSFGGYFAACYTMKYPEHVEALILASPVGMGERKPVGPFTDPNKRAELPLMRRWLINVAEFLWEARCTPQDIVRFAGPFGHRLTAWYVDSRFQHVREAGTMKCDPDAMKDYLYHLAAQPGCSEYCLGEILSFGAFARQPIAARLAERLKQLGSSAPPVACLYGERDWMDSAHGVWLAQTLCQAGAKYHCDVLRIEGAGHQIFIDHPRAFSAAVHHLLGRRSPAIQGLYHTLYSPKSVT
eukprot:TRINITY_DN24622_c0_g1_i1.p1 TRINITY_DN24622_c0_g1~~TRINITY_DN24622_c0_g1_i1.p1  ORF type:complete len:381 (-),score=24.82 TRINITY_DN24622_c0_g1_i1:27-1169(-)